MVDSRLGQAGQGIGWLGGRVVGWSGGTGLTCGRVVGWSGHLEGEERVELRVHLQLQGLDERLVLGVPDHQVHVVVLPAGQQVLRPVGEEVTLVGQPSPDLHPTFT